MHYMHLLVRNIPLVFPKIFSTILEIKQCLHTAIFNLFREKATLQKEISSAEEAIRKRKAEIEVRSSK